MPGIMAFSALLTEVSIIITVLACSVLPSLVPEPVTVVVSVPEPAAGSVMIGACVVRFTRD